MITKVKKRLWTSRRVLKPRLFRSGSTHTRVHSILLYSGVHSSETIRQRSS